MDEEPRHWVDDLFGSYGAVRRWIVSLLAPGLAASEMIQGRLRLGVGLAFVSVALWTDLARRLGAESRGAERLSQVSLAVGGVLLAWHYASWWIGYLR